MPKIASNHTKYLFDFTNIITTTEEIRVAEIYTLMFGIFYTSHTIRVQAGMKASYIIKILPYQASPTL